MEPVADHSTASGADAGLEHAADTDAPAQGDGASHLSPVDAGGVDAASALSNRFGFGYLFFSAAGGGSQDEAQAVSRLVIVAMMTVSVGLAAVLGDVTPSTLPLMSLGLIYILIGLPIYLWFTRVRFGHVWLRYLAMAADFGAVGIITWIGGLDGLGFYTLYVWGIIGNGMRFGPPALMQATLLGLCSFILANFASGVAFSHTLIFSGLLLGLLLMPRYLHLALSRMAESQQALARRKAAAERMARHDALTGLPNRYLLLQRMQHAIRHARRKEHGLAVLFLDLDGFKRVNDTYGHDYGDKLLVQVADCLRGTMRQVDTVSRLGGDEFIVLVEGYERLGDISAVVERLFGCARRFYRVGEVDVYVSWSCGVAVYPKDGEDPDALIRNADIAMYQAKSRGSNQAVTYDPEMSARVMADLRLRDELRRGIAAREFFPVYHPQCLAGAGDVVLIEALARWRHPRRGLLGPHAFLDMANSSGLMAQIDLLVIEQALRDIALLRAGKRRNIRLAVNVTPRQFESEAFSDRLLELLRANDLPPAILDLEITEKTLLKETEVARSTLRRLRDHGVRIVLDDFGTGYASLLHLRHFSIDQIKLDRVFIGDLPTDVRSAAVVEGVITMAQRLGLSVAADGIERLEQCDWLKSKGCTRVQGHCYSEAKEFGELELLLAGNPCVACGSCG